MVHWIALEKNQKGQNHWAYSYYNGEKVILKINIRR